MKELVIVYNNVDYTINNCVLINSRCNNYHTLLYNYCISVDQIRITYTVCVIYYY